MANKHLVVFGIYKDRIDLDRAVSQLRTEGFHNSDVSALLPNNDTTQEFAHEKGTKAPEGATTGASTGAILGGTLGWLAGIGSLAIPGIGPFIAAGPIMAALAGAGIGGALGGLTGALVGMGLPEYEAKRYEGLMKDGGILLSVHCDNRTFVDRAKRVLEATGAHDVSSTQEAHSDRTDRFDDNNPRDASFPRKTPSSTMRPELDL